ncbi:hypothetical protein J6TS1_38270 [Siminovitchia terrae]|uniref:Uncharacterized protein n=1 Tax=Siminovitchia terrae TaxID=1914933 RepID=A0ABQ4L325_SIMTE|nr:hypothetical protein J6TS1_38270 [Siminovitchia terrae]
MYNVFAFKIKKRVFARIIIKGYECHCDDGNRAPDAVNVSVLKSSLNPSFTLKSQHALLFFQPAR